MNFPGDSLRGSSRCHPWLTSLIVDRGGRGSRQGGIRVSVENHQKLQAAFIAGRLDASLAADRGRWGVQERRDMEVLLGMVLGDADLRELADRCEVLFKKAEDPDQRHGLVRGLALAAALDDLAAPAGLRMPGNGNGGKRP